jgi:hypothetical protein
VVPVDAGEVLSRAEIPSLDPTTLAEAEIEAVVTSDRPCEFRYTSAGRPVLVVGTGPGGEPARAVVKLVGDIVALEPAATGDGASAAEPQQRTIRVSAGRIALSVTPEPPADAVQEGVTRRQANMIFRVGDEFEVGYRGYFDCGTRLGALSYPN